MHIYRREATKIFQLCSAYHMCINAIAIPVKKRDHDYITVISQTSHKCEVIIKTSQ